MWLELSNSVWVNSDHLVRVEFVTEEGKFKGTLTTIKPGGSDRTFIYDDDARKVKEMLESTRVTKTVKKQKVD